VNWKDANLQDLLLLFSYRERTEVLTYLLLSPGYSEDAVKSNPVFSHLIQFYAILEIAASQGYVNTQISGDLAERALVHLSLPAFRSQRCQSRMLLDALHARLQSLTTVTAGERADTHDLLAHLLGLISRVQDDIDLEELRQGLQFGAPSSLPLLSEMLRHDQEVFSALIGLQASSDSRLLGAMFRLFRLLVAVNNLIARADRYAEFRDMVACVVAGWLNTQNKLAGIYLLSCIDRVARWPVSIGASPTEWPHEQATTHLEAVREAVRRLFGVSSVPSNLHITLLGEPLPPRNEDVYSAAASIGQLMSGAALQDVQMQSLYEDLTSSTSGRLLRDLQ